MAHSLLIQRSRLRRGQQRAQQRQRPTRGPAMEEPATGRVSRVEGPERAPDPSQVRGTLSARKVPTKALVFTGLGGAAVGAGLTQIPAFGGPDFTPGRPGGGGAPTGVDDGTAPDPETPGDEPSDRGVLGRILDAITGGIVGFLVGLGMTEEAAKTFGATLGLGVLILIAILVYRAVT